MPHAREAVEAVRAAGVGVCVASQGRLAKTNAHAHADRPARPVRRGCPVLGRVGRARASPIRTCSFTWRAASGFAPDRTAVVEDSASGVRAGVAAGMRVLGYAADGDARVLGGAGAELISSMVEVPERLGLA